MITWIGPNDTTVQYPFRFVVVNSCQKALHTNCKEQGQNREETAIKNECPS